MRACTTFSSTYSSTYVAYSDRSSGVPAWAAKSYVAKRQESAALVLQRALLRHSKRARAAAVIQDWWMRQTFVHL